MSAEFELNVPDWFMEEFRLAIQDHIERTGWHAQGVFATEDEPGPCWVYTMGLRERDMPELIVIGLPPEQGHELLHAAVVQMEEGWRPRHGEVRSGVIQAPYDVGFVEVTDEGAWANDWFNVAKAFYGRQAVAPTFQIIWPDEDGAFRSHLDLVVNTQPPLGNVPWWLDEEEAVR